MLTFETARLHVRPLTEADEALYCGLYTDPDTMRHIDVPLSPERAARSFRKALAQTNRPAHAQFLAMFERCTHRAIGLCGMQPHDAARRQVEIGVLLVPEARTLGFAGECLEVLVSQAFLALPIDAVWAQYHPTNATAERLFKGLGFLPRIDGEIGGECGLQRVCFVRRSSWGSSTLQTTMERVHVERDRIS